MIKRVLSSIAFLTAATVATSQVWISEVLINAPNGPDDNREFFEVQGPPNFGLNGWYFLAIDGDGGNAGVVDQVIDLTGLSTGANGLLLVMDPNIVLFPTPDPLTSIFITAFTPDIENGTNTFVLGYGTPPQVGDDLDLDNDGTLDAGQIVGFTVVDAVSHLENDGVNNYAYADDLGFPEAVFGPYSYTADALYRVRTPAGNAPAGWALGDVLGVDPGPFTFDLARSDRFSLYGYPDPSVVPVSPGSLNAVNLLPGFSFQGTIDLQNYDGSLATQSIEFVITDTIGNVVQTETVPLTATGAYSFSSTLPAGSYLVKAKGATWLRKSVLRVVDGTSNQTVDFSLINGDADGDNEVSIGDFAVISANFGTSGPLGDLNGDDEVDIGDYAIMSGNFGLLGDD